MFESVAAAEILGAMITPAVLISAAGTLALSTSNRIARVVDRVRVMGQEAERLNSGESTGKRYDKKSRYISKQLETLSVRVLHLRAALTALYVAIGVLVTTSIAIGVVAELRWQHSWIPVVLGLLGTTALLYASLLLIREARLAVASLMQEAEHAKGLLQREESE